MQYDVEFGLEEHIIKEYKILYKSKNRVFKVYKNNIDISYILSNLWTEYKFRNYSNHIYDCKEYTDLLYEIIYELFNITLEIKNTLKNGELYCYLSTHIFECLSTYGEFLKLAEKPINSLTYYRAILNFVYSWEKEDDVNILHKGTLYGLLANTYMSIGDIELGFTFFHRAVNEDYRIKDFIDGYPKNAPSYKIIMLKNNKDHFMAEHVSNIRVLLNYDITEFSKLFPKYAEFNIDNFDELLIENELFDGDDLQTIRINTLYYIWVTYIYIYKVGFYEEISDFDNLNRIQKLFGMCVVIEALGKKIIKFDSDYTKDNAKKLYEFIGGIMKIDGMIGEVYKKDDNFNELIIELIDFDKKKFRGHKLGLLERCVLIYVLIRNFTAHNIEAISAVGINFRKITQVLLYLELLILIHNPVKSE